MTQPKGTALITGASSGIGALYADRFARQGHDLILVARNASKLERVAKGIRSATGRTVYTLPADLIDRSDPALVEARLRNDRSISVLVNNAGTGSTARALDADVATMSRMIALNVETVMRLSYAAIGPFVARNRGTIVNIASIAAVAPELLNGVYGGTKAFVVAFSQNLHHELKTTAVRVQVVLPGAIATGFWDIAGTPVSYLPSEIVMQPGDLVDAALAGLAHGELATLPGLHDDGLWADFEAARQAMSGALSTRTPAERYLTG